MFVVKMNVVVSLLVLSQVLTPTATYGQGQGHYGRLHRRVTAFSRQMDLRNQAISRGIELEEEGIAQRLPVTATTLLLHPRLQPPGRAKRQSQPQPNVVIISCDENQSFVCNASDRFRTISGLCNNLDQPLWGSSNIALRRFIEPAYADGLGRPRGGFQNEDNQVFQRRHSCRNPDPTQPLPNPRFISTRFHPDQDVPSSELTHMITQFGQFLDHDISFTPESSLGEDCCNNPLAPECFPIQIPIKDPFFECINFGRSSSFCLDPTKPREQMNALTAFLDCSHTYGSTDDEARSLRAFRDGLMRTSFRGRNARELLAEDENGFFLSGDVRGTEMPALAAMHTIFVREHNRVARQLSLRNPSLNDEELFQRSRRIVIAEWQNMVYAEYLPIIIGSRLMKRNRLNGRRRGRINKRDFRTKYDPKMNPSIKNSFATAAFRFGHTQVQGLVQVIGKSGLTNSSYQLRDHFFSMNQYLSKDGLGLEDILNGLTMQPAQERDRFVSSDITNTLFPGIDLVARNIQRGRDHGLPGYNEFREFCGLSRVCRWQDRPKEISQTNWQLLREIYEHPNDIDFFPAGMAEERHMDGILGKTFSCILERTFKSLQDGDRFFFSHDNEVGFSDAQLQNLKRRTLRDVLCENSDINSLQDNVFLIRGRRRSCSRTNRINFDLFT